MPHWLAELFKNGDAFIPHGHCYLWVPSLLWMHVISDTLIGIAYLGISLVLYLFVRKVRLPFSPVFIAFGLFIALCGLTHFMAVWTVWNPDYWADGLLKAATAAASVATAIGLVFVRPQVEEVIHTARLSEERRIQLETTNSELEALYKRVKEQDELKTQFFANISHELRTPLALILGPAEGMLDDNNLDADQRRQLRSISNNGKSLLKQVNDLLDLAKLEEGKMPIQYVRLDLAPWLRRIASQFEIAADDRGISYHFSGPNSLLVEVDPDMLERVFINLLSNAFKFTPSNGEIRIELQGGKDEFTLSVADTGPGVSPGQHEVIFERFHQSHGNATHKHGGTGLGLAIVKDFVDLHGGDIDLASGPGDGAKFVVRMPVRAPKSAVVKDAPPSLATTSQVALESTLRQLRSEPTNQAVHEAPPTNPDQPSVLVVEDTPEMSRFIADILGGDYSVVTAADGKDGLAKATTLKPDLIITDIMMPRMSGDQLVSELRSKAEFDAVPILLLTAKADDALRVELLQTGAQDYLTKPFLPRELLARASNLIAMKRTGDALRAELASASTDMEGLANELAVKHRELQIALDSAEVAQEQAERASEVKSNFLGLISHEMRTPLSTVQMTTQLMCRHGVSDQLPRSFSAQLERVARAAQQLSTLIEGLLEYTRLESGRIVPQIQPIDTHALAKEIVETGHSQIASPQVVSLVLAPLPTDLPPLQADPRLLRVVLNNLVSNALKFTNEGKVTLRLRATGGYHVFEVEDTGVGILEEDLSRVFEPFEQLEPLQRKSIPGVGLGLALTKEIMETLGGSIEVASAKGEGSTFRVFLPSQPENYGNPNRESS